MKTALVTGAGSGIGRHSAIALAQAGFAVALAGRRAAALDETAALIERTGSDVPVIVAPTDVTRVDSVTALVEQIASQWGRLDVLFNNAGINVPATPLEDLAASDWEVVIATNLTGAFLCTQAAFRLMKAQRPQGGRIINNGSVSAQAPRPDSIAYTASKHAITGLTKSTSLDGRKYGIACGQIDIGNASTEMTSRMQQGVPQADGTLAPEPTFDVAHVAQAVVQMAELPLEANIQFITIMATRMPLVGRG